MIINQPVKRAPRNLITIDPVPSGFQLTCHGTHTGRNITTSIGILDAEDLAELRDKIDLIVPRR